MLTSNVEIVLRIIGKMVVVFLCLPCLLVVNDLEFDKQPNDDWERLNCSMARTI